MYDVEKRSAVLENAAGFARLDAYVYILLLLLLECIMYKSTLGQSCPMQHCVIHNRTSL